jgi:hypothetical protein
MYYHNVSCVPILTVVNKVEQIRHGETQVDK